MDKGVASTKATDCHPGCCTFDKSADVPCCTTPEKIKGTDAASCNCTCIVDSQEQPQKFGTAKDGVQCQTKCKAQFGVQDFISSRCTAGESCACKCDLISQNEPQGIGDVLDQTECRTLCESRFGASDVLAGQCGT
jgi:hypothetical protein